MDQKEIVFIVGAGASRELGFPTGEELKAQIVSELEIVTEQSEESIIYNTIVNNLNFAEVVYRLEDYLYKASEIKYFLPFASSIDNYIYTHRDDKITQYIAKLSICHCIINAERSSKLYSELGSPLLPSNQLKDTWLIPFSQLLTEKCDKNEIKARLQKIGFIIFNYDRSVEFFLYNFIQGYFGFSDRDTFDCLTELNIVHPYGTLGPIGWQNDSDFQAYGVLMHENDLHRRYNNIITFNEDIDSQNNLLLETQKLATNTRRVVFLGFGYHEQNIRIMHDLEDISNTNFVMIYGTTYKESKFNIDYIRNRITKVFPNGNIHSLESESCFDFLKNHRLALSTTGWI